MRHHVDGVVDDVGVVVVQRDQLAVALEGVESVVAALAEPRRACAKSVPTWLKTPSSSTRRPRPVRLGDQLVEVGVVAEPRVDAVVVGGVVAVRARREDRAERDARRAELDRVVEPFDDPAQPVLVGGRRRIGGKRADEAQRVDLPPDRVLDPGGLASCTPELRLVEGFHRVGELWCGAVDDDAGATVVIGSGATGGGGAPHSASHCVSCADEVAYTMRPRPDPGVRRRAHRAVLAGGVDGRPGAVGRGHVVDGPARDREFRVPGVVAALDAVAVLEARPLRRRPGSTERLVAVVERHRPVHAAAEAIEVVVADRHRPEFTDA